VKKRGAKSGATLGQYKGGSKIPIKNSSSPAKCFYFTNEKYWGKKWGKTVYLINFEIKIIKYDYKKNYKIFNT
jgi:hypothetical protein